MYGAFMGGGTSTWLLGVKYMPRANMHPWSIINVEDGKLILPPICEVCHKPLKKREMKYLRTKDGGYISCTCEKCVARMLSQDIEGFEIKQNASI